jgi:hypothetical protein
VESLQRAFPFRSLDRNWFEVSKTVMRVVGCLRDRCPLCPYDWSPGETVNTRFCPSSSLVSQDDRITNSDPSVTDYILEAPAQCPNCQREILEKALVVARLICSRKLFSSNPASRRKAKQICIDLILMRGREAVWRARIVDFLRALDELGRLLRRVLNGLGELGRQESCFRNQW